MARAEEGRRRLESVTKKKLTQAKDEKVLNIHLSPSDAALLKKLRHAFQYDSEKETIVQLVRLAAKYTPIREAVDLETIMRAAFEGRTPSNLTYEKPSKHKPGGNSEPKS